MDSGREIRNIKRTNCIMFGIFAIILLAVLAAVLTGHFQHSFTTEKWKEDPDHRTRIVDDLLRDYDLEGMTESEIISLLGEHNNDYGYFAQADRFVYCLGPERGLFRIDNEWLILDFEAGIVTDCRVTTD